MVDDIGAVRRLFQAQAKRYERRAEESSTTGLREYYRGKAEMARAAATSVRRVERTGEDLDPSAFIEKRTCSSE